MPSFPTKPPDERWTITPQGRRASDIYELCVCDVKLVGILLACPDCGTVYGSIKDATKPRAQRWTYGKRA